MRCSYAEGVGERLGAAHDTLCLSSQGRDPGLELANDLGGKVSGNISSSFD
jgi:hypothetical protein